MLKFSNPGELSLTMLRTFGVTSKPAAPQAGAFGQFGTGLKYAIAGILRAEGSISLSTGGNLWHFGTSPENIRGKEVSRVTMHNEGSGELILLPFTTDLGSHWGPWMWFRELYCNAKDEGGGMGDRAEWKEETIFIVECEELEASDYKEHFLAEGSVPLAVFPGLEVFLGPSNSLFYKGVKVASTPRKMLYTYNILGKMDLTEDRTVPMWSAQCALMRSIAQADDEGMDYAANIITADEGFDEAYWDWQYSGIEPSEGFKKFLVANFRNGKLSHRAKVYTSSHWQDELGYKFEPFTEAEREVVKSLRPAFVVLNIDFPQIFKTSEMGEYYPEAGKFQETIYVNSKALKSKEELFGVVIVETAPVEKRRNFTSILLLRSVGMMELAGMRLEREEPEEEEI